jgi:hypothetical protein
MTLAKTENVNASHAMQVIKVFVGTIEYQPHAMLSTNNIANLLQHFSFQ